VAHRMNPAVELHAQQLSGGALKRGVGDVRVRPLDQYGFMIDPARRLNGRSGHIPRDLQTGGARVVRRKGTGRRKLFEMNGVEPAVSRIVGIELETDEPAREPAPGSQLVEQAGPGATVEVE